MSKIKLVWITPDIEQVIIYQARASNPENQKNKNIVNLIKSCIKNNHWSVFEMGSMSVEINTTRDISKQIIRHRSFSFQEFSQRYADVNLIQKDIPIEELIREARTQDPKNRQNSIKSDDYDLNYWWKLAQQRQIQNSIELYNHALKMGIAKELARVLLPEGLTTTRLYMAGNIRNWIHYVSVRAGNGTQKEHMDIANEIKNLMYEQMPNISEAAFGNRE